METEEEDQDAPQDAVEAMLALVDAQVQQAAEAEKKADADLAED